MWTPSESRKITSLEREEAKKQDCEVVETKIRKRRADDYKGIPTKNEERKV
jgi:hypothetical protein